MQNMHKHSENCGHKMIKHDGHIDYLENGKLVYQESGEVIQHTIEVSDKNPAECTENSPAIGHDTYHVHGPNCGHEAVPHGDHTDYLVDGVLHHFHGDHCDNHGKIDLV